jgi:hypothetical protein
VEATKQEKERKEEKTFAEERIAAVSHLNY